MGTDNIARAWDREYRQGRYRDQPPVAFVEQIRAAVTAEPAARPSAAEPGLYLGCGNGRNYLPLVDAGIPLLGIDLSAVAIGQLAERRPDQRDRLRVGDLSVLPAGQRFPLVVGIQVFQHGDRATTHAMVTDAAGRVAPGGLLAVRVNAVGTDVEQPHEIAERAADGSFSLRYTGGPKSGLTVHFWAALELHELLGGAGLEPVHPPRADTTWRQPLDRGQWLQWEAIYRRPHQAG